MKFNKLDVPYQWKEYFTKYPHGYTIFEALCNWTKQVDEMVDNVNDWNNYLDIFVKTFDKNLQGKVIETLGEWQESGLLDVVIDEALQTEMDTLEVNTNNKLNAFESQLAEKVNKSEHRNIYISKNEPMGSVGDIWLKPAPLHLLYDRGFEFIEWEQGQLLEELGGTSKIEKSWDGITLTSQTSTSSGSTSLIELITKTPIDMTNLSELGIEFDGVLSTGSSPRSNVVFRVSEKDNKEGYVLTTALFKDQKKATIDVSALTGLHYVKVRTYANTEQGSGTAQLSKVRVLKVWGD